MEPISKKELNNYLVEKKVFSSIKNLKTTDILLEMDDSEGYVNHILQVKDQITGKSVVVKQVMPYALTIKRARGAVFPMSDDRIVTETRVLTFLNTLLEGIAPEIYHIDPKQHLIVMEDLSNLELMRFGLTACKTYDDVSATIGAFLAGVYFYTSELTLTKNKKAELLEYFKNKESKFMLNIIFGDVFILNQEKPTEPEAKELRNKLSTDVELITIIKKLAKEYELNEDCLLHNDLHASNIFLDKSTQDIKIIDFEFAGFGPIWMDLGRLLASYLINYLSWTGRTDLPMEKRQSMQNYDLKLINDLFNGFRLTFNKLFKTQMEKIPELKHVNPQVLYLDILRKSLQISVLGLLLRTPSDDARSCDVVILSPEALAHVQIRGMQIADYVLKNANTFDSIEAFCEFLVCCCAVENQ